MTLPIVANGVDSTRTVLRITDEFGALRAYSNDSITLSLESPARLIGDNPFALVGGTDVVWLRVPRTWQCPPHNVASAPWFADGRVLPYCCAAQQSLNCYNAKDAVLGVLPPFAGMAELADAADSKSK